jgi:hypothetical protein
LNICQELQIFCICIYVFLVQVKSC